MVTKQKGGKIQYYTGIILLIVTIVGSIFVFYSVVNSFTEVVGSETGTWSEVANTLDEGSPENKLITGMLVSHLVTQGLVVRTAGFTFAFCTLLLIAMSVMFILQGVANQSKK